MGNLLMVIAANRNRFGVTRDGSHHRHRRATSPQLLTVLTRHIAPAKRRAPRLPRLWWPFVPDTVARCAESGQGAVADCVPAASSRDADFPPIRGSHFVVDGFARSYEVCSPRDLLFCVSRSWSCDFSSQVHESKEC